MCNFLFVLLEYLSIPRSILPSVSPAAKAVTLQSRHQGSEPLCTVYQWEAPNMTYLRLDLVNIMIFFQIEYTFRFGKMSLIDYVCFPAVNSLIKQGDFLAQDAHLSVQFLLCTVYCVLWLQIYLRGFLLANTKTNIFGSYFSDKYIWRVVMNKSMNINSRTSFCKFVYKYRYLLHTKSETYLYVHKSCSFIAFGRT